MTDTAPPDVYDAFPALGVHGGKPRRIPDRFERSGVTNPHALLEVIQDTADELFVMVWRDKDTMDALTNTGTRPTEHALFARFDDQIIGPVGWVWDTNAPTERSTT